MVHKQRPEETAVCKTECYLPSIDRPTFVCESVKNLAGVAIKTVHCVKYDTVVFKAACLATCLDCQCCISKR